eukprot:TRINITY_DN4289_c0_g1_i6.p1 TRINITY_DN4289_c0_g1~~TRINITY_DN4289_c0_g1_i6.p1  ORF type:complete len:262 (-),score=64.78 TRINITY_DN4289_c0_g1_i6:426-1211(-)
MSILKDAQFVGQAGQGGSVFDTTGKYKLLKEGAYAAIEVGISAIEGAKSSAGTMVGMSPNTSLKVSFDGSFGQACCRCCCAGGSLFMNHYTLKSGDRGDVLVAPAAPGEIVMLHLSAGAEWALAKNAFLCCDYDISIGTMVQNLSQSCCSGQGIFVMKATGMGRLLVSSFGSILKYDLGPGEQRLIDNGYLVAWNIKDYAIVKAADTISGSIFSGEGFATKFTGPGTVYLQTRSPKALAELLQPYLPSGGGGGGGGDSGGN